MTTAFAPSARVLTRVASPSSPSSSALHACRRNNKMEKRKRNRDYARKFASKTGGSRRKTVVEEKRLVVAASEERFQAQVFSMTTDDDMPEYNGFDFIQ
jgi:hypothetical protein